MSKDLKGLALCTPLLEAEIPATHSLILLRRLSELMEHSFWSNDGGPGIIWTMGANPNPHNCPPIGCFASLLAGEEPPFEFLGPFAFFGLFACPGN
jgi:hypothetical protein